MLDRLNRRVPGAAAKFTNIHMQGEEVAIVILDGCIWDDEGTLTLKGINSDPPAES